MRRVLKWTGILLGATIVVLALLAAGLYVNTSLRFAKTYNVPAETIPVPTDAASIDRGRHLVSILCKVCHGDDLSGTVIFQDPGLGRVTAANLTAGRGGVGARLRDADFVRAVRHGVSSSGKALFIMPSEGYYYLSDTDLGAIIAYVKSVPPVDHEISERVVTNSLARVLISAGAFGKVFAAEDIDHTGARPTAAAPGVTVTYGDYLVRVGECRTCHGANLGGGKDPNPQAPPAPNLTQGGELRAWSAEDFIRTLHTGETPGGHQLSEFMPWRYAGQMTDDELRSVWLYLESLPPITSR